PGPPPQPTPPTRPAFDRIVDGLAGSQHGVVTRRQLMDAGIAPGVIDRRVKSGRLKRLHRGVYLVGPLLPALGREMAACLACGPSAVLSHRSAAVVWGLLASGRQRAVDISVRRGSPRRPGIVTHRPTRLAPDETTVLEEIPITTPGRTIYDLARTVRGRAFERAVSQVLASGRMTPEALTALAPRYAGRPGGRRFLEALGEDGPRFTRSEAEARFLRLLDRARIPPPLINRVIAGYEVDFHWPAHRLVVEIDGFAYHASRRSFERDRVRDADLSGAGHRVVRITWRQLSREPLVVAARLGALLGASAQRWRGNRPVR
ncbi:MAG: type IV toxin-antitoxin system AbiEi family antitoxin domain-containing protein, partial [Gemmatimonadota bacterium]